MGKKFIILLLGSVVWLLSSMALAQAIEVPHLTQRVTDLTGTVSDAQLATLEGELSVFEDSTSTQVIVLMIPTLGSESLEDYSYRVAAENRIGQKEINNGVLLLIVKNQRRIRIEVGYGLEGALTDALSGIIIRHEIAPHFRDGDYYAGIKAGIEAIMAATQHEYTVPKERKESPIGLAPLFLFLLIFFFAFRGLFLRRRAMRGGFLPIFFGGGMRGGGFGGGGSFGGGGASGSW